MSANEYQHAGDHYQTSFQHWDFVVATQINYLQGQVVKYITRWRKKNGLEDLRKAHHFAEKWREIEEARVAGLRRMLNLYMESNELSQREGEIIGRILVGDSEGPPRLIQLLIDDEEAGPQAHGYVDQDR